MNGRRLIRKLTASKHIVNVAAQPSFSQAGEDMIVNFLFQQLRIRQLSYLDIGTNLPVRGNNTHFFYNKGNKGVCVEPDRELYALIKKERPRDVVLNAGIGLDLAILKTLDFSIYKHQVICAETVEFNPSRPAEKINETGVFLESKGYFVFADTFINTIFCRKDVYNQ